MGLTDVSVRNAKPRAARYKMSDGDGLYLLVMPSGTKSWRWRQQVEGREKIVTLGTYPEVGLGAARVARDKLRAPGGRALEFETRTLAQIAKDWHATQAPLWKDHHAADVWGSLEREVWPELKDAGIRATTAPQILKVLRAVQERGAIELAHRLRQRLADIWTFAIAAGEAETNPAAGLAPALMPVVRSGRRPAVTDLAGAREAFAAAEDIPSHPIVRLAHRLLALTALRPGELRQGLWTEVDGNTWRIPAARMKHTQRRAADVPDHVVPLSAQAVDAFHVLRQLSGTGPLMFPSWSSTRRPISENALVFLLQRAGLGGVQVPHGWRSSFSSIMNELHPSDQAIIDLMLAHAPKSAVEGTYNRALHIPRRREIAQEWADLLLIGRPDAAEIIKGRRR